METNEKILVDWMMRVTEEVSNLLQDKLPGHSDKDLLENVYMYYYPEESKTEYFYKNKFLFTVFSIFLKSHGLPIGIIQW